eukprot:2781126-Rhodomonas_salina.1
MTFALPHPAPRSAASTIEPFSSSSCSASLRFSFSFPRCAAALRSGAPSNDLAARTLGVIDIGPASNPAMSNSRSRSEAPRRAACIAHRTSGRPSSPTDDAARSSEAMSRSCDGESESWT